MLRSEDNSVKATAKSVGYDDQLAFFRAFKRHVGVSPSEYRKNAEKIQKTVDKAKSMVYNGLNCRSGDKAFQDYTESLRC